MSDNSFKTFYEELKLLVEKFEKKQTQIKMEHDLDFDSVKIFGEKMDSVTRAKLGIDEVAELAYTTAEHHPYWSVLYNCAEITKTILEKWHDEITDVPDDIDIVDVFRPSDQVMPIIKEAIKKKPKVIWLQEGIHNKEAEKLAHDVGIDVIFNRCMLAEHSRLT